MARRTLTPAEAAAALQRFATRTVPRLEYELQFGLCATALRFVHSIEPVRSGKYAASHRVSRNRPVGARLGDLPSFSSPGEDMIVAGLRGYKPGDKVFMANDASRMPKPRRDKAGRFTRRDRAGRFAARRVRHVYAMNIEVWGWPGGPKSGGSRAVRAPYRVYHRADLHLRSKWPSIRRAAATRAMRGAPP